MRQLASILGEELFSQVKEALKGKGHNGKDIELAIANDGSYVPKHKLDEKLDEIKALERQIEDACRELRIAGLHVNEATMLDDIKKVKESLDSTALKHKVQLELKGVVHDFKDIEHLLDYSQFKFDKDGKLTNLDKEIGKLRESKPYLFVAKDEPKDKPAETEGKQDVTFVTGAKPKDSVEKPLYQDFNDGKPVVL